MRRLAGLISMALAAAVLAGCGSYYMVKDPNSNNVYYTEKIDKNINGAVSFKDAKTKSEVTLQSSAITEISGDEFDKAVGDQ